MVDVKRPGDEVIGALRKEKIDIGRVRPSLPAYVRVSIGTQEEMNKFKRRFSRFVGQPEVGSCASLEAETSGCAVIRPQPEDWQRDDFANYCVRCGQQLSPSTTFGG
jgi:hypothetical protein